jgi:hypothetical protein
MNYKDDEENEIDINEIDNLVWAAVSLVKQITARAGDSIDVKFNSDLKTAVRLDINCSEAGVEVAALRVQLLCCLLTERNIRANYSDGVVQWTAVRLTVHRHFHNSNTQIVMFSATGSYRQHQIIFCYVTYSFML